MEPACFSEIGGEHKQLRDGRLPGHAQVSGAQAAARPGHGEPAAHNQPLISSGCGLLCHLTTLL